MPRSVLVTGVSRHLGGDYVRRLSADTSIERIIGVDVVAPAHPLGRAEFVRADIRNPVIGTLIEQSGVDTVVHMNVISTPTSAGGRLSQKEINVIGTMQLLAACQKSASVRRLVVKSSATVYGSSAKDPALFTEQMQAVRPPAGGWGKDSIEVEDYVRGFSARRPDVDVLVLRFAHVLGPRIRTSLTDYFGMPVLPVPFGYDARLQFVHEEDCVAAMVQATRAETTGVVNVAADGVITLTQAAAKLRRPISPIALGGTGLAGMGLLSAGLRRAGVVDLSTDLLRYLAHGRVVDTAMMRADLGFEPAYTTRETFESFARAAVTVLPMIGPIGPPGAVSSLVFDAVGSAASILTQVARNLSRPR